MLGQVWSVEKRKKQFVSSDIQIDYCKRVKQIKQLNFGKYTRGGSRIFSRGGGGGFSKSFPKFWRPFLQNFLRRRQIFETNSQKSRFWALFEKLWQKNRVFFWRAFPLKVSIYWRPRRLKKNFRVGRPKLDFWKSIKGGTLWVGRGSNPWGGGGGGASAPPLNPPLKYTNCLKRVD